MRLDVGGFEREDVGLSLRRDELGFGINQKFRSAGTFWTQDASGFRF